MALSLDHHRLKDPLDWTPGEVRDWLEGILPGHPCVDLFSYTSGYVLCSLEKQDLRRQARDEEAANIIWAELKGCRGPLTAGQTPGATAVPGDRHGGLDETVDPQQQMVVYVRTKQETAIELQVSASDSVASVKAQIAEREGTPQESQRLVTAGMSMQDDRSLASYGVRHGATLLLVPQLREQSSRSANRVFAPRGMLMVPGSKSWHPSATRSNKPLMPVLCSDVSRNFPISLEFASAAECEDFAVAAREGPPLLEILLQGAGSDALPLETRVFLDQDTGGVTLESSGNKLMPGKEYEAFLHFAGRGGQTKVTLATGAAVA